MSYFFRIFIVFWIPLKSHSLYLVPRLQLKYTSGGTFYTILLRGSKDAKHFRDPQALSETKIIGCFPAPGTGQKYNMFTWCILVSSLTDFAPETSIHRYSHWLLWILCTAARINDQVEIVHIIRHKWYSLQQLVQTNCQNLHLKVIQVNSSWLLTRPSRYVFEVWRAWRASRMALSPLLGSKFFQLGHGCWSQVH